MRPLLLALCLLALLPALAAADGRCGPQTCRADVGVSGHAEPQPIRVGDTSEYKITAMNNGPDGALAVDLQIDVPAGLEIVSVTNFGGNGCSRDGTFVRCDLGDFASQQQAVVRIKVKGVKEGTFIARARVYASDVDDPNGGNGQVGATLLVQDRAGGSTSGGPRLSLGDPQRILRTGGISLVATPATGGTLRARGEVRTPRGIVRLKSVTRGGVGAGSRQRVFLGTSSTALRRIRSALRPSWKRLRVIVWVTVDGRTTRRELHVRR